MKNDLCFVYNKKNIPLSCVKESLGFITLNKHSYSYFPLLYVTKEYVQTIRNVTAQNTRDTALQGTLEII